MPNSRMEIRNPPKATAENPNGRVKSVCNQLGGRQLKGTVTRRLPESVLGYRRLKLLLPILGLAVTDTIIIPGACRHFR